MKRPTMSQTRTPLITRWSAARMICDMSLRNGFTQGIGCGKRASCRIQIGAENRMKRVDYYSKARVKLEIFFPEDKTVCQWCPYCRNEDSLKRWKCLLTGEYLLYPFHGVGNSCPAELEDRITKERG